MSTGLLIRFGGCGGSRYREPAWLDWLQCVLLRSLCYAGVFMVVVVVPVRMMLVMVLSVMVMLVMGRSFMSSKGLRTIRCILGIGVDGSWRCEGLCTGVGDKRYDGGDCEAHYRS